MMLYRDTIYGQGRAIEYLADNGSERTRLEESKNYFRSIMPRHRLDIPD